jgi:hypothetical protein
MFPFLFFSSFRMTVAEKRLGMRGVAQAQAHACSQFRLRVFFFCFFFFLAIFPSFHKTVAHKRLEMRGMAQVQVHACSQFVLRVFFFFFCLGRGAGEAERMIS